jgi:hypothetical protein
MIQEDEMPLRLWPQSNPNIEARLCEKCQTEYLGIDTEEDETKNGRACNRQGIM